VELRLKAMPSMVTLSMTFLGGVHARGGLNPFIDLARADTSLLWPE
jgi:hypothetical protein